MNTVSDLMNTFETIGKKTGNHITSMEETPEIITRNAEEKAKDIKIDNAWDSKANPTCRSLAFLN